MKLLPVPATALLVAVSGCASFTVNSQWKDPQWDGPPAAHVMVVGITRSDTLRRVFEDTFAQQLQAAGVQASASYAQIPSGGEAATKLGDLIKSSGADAVLTTRVQRVEHKIDVTPGGPSYGGFYGWYGNAWASTPEVTQYDVVTLETSVWDVKSEKLVWTVTTQGLASNNIPKATAELAQTLIPKMKADRVIR